MGGRGFEPPTSPANIDGTRAVLNLHRSCTKMEIMERRIVRHFVQFSGLFAGRKPAPMLKGVFEIRTIYAQLSSYFMKGAPQERGKTHVKPGDGDLVYLSIHSESLISGLWHRRVSH